MNQLILSIDSKGRKQLNIVAKKSIIELGEKGISHQKIADMFGIGRSTVTKILLNKESILESAGRGFDNAKIYSENPGLFELEVKLFRWSVEDISLKKKETNVGLGYNLVKQVSKQNNIFKYDIKKTDITNKAIEFASEIGLSYFEPTDEWFNRFKRRFNIRFRKCPRIYTKSSTDDPMSDPSPEMEVSNATSPSSHITCNYIVKSNVPDDFKIGILNQVTTLPDNSKYYCTTDLFEEFHQNPKISPTLDQNLLIDRNSHLNFNEHGMANTNINFLSQDNITILPSNVIFNNQSTTYGFIHDSSIFNYY